MEIENIKYEQKEAVLYITICREKQLNALNKKTIAELSYLLSQYKKDDTVRVLILTGAGEKAFVAGADIKEFANFTAKEGEELAKSGHDNLFTKVAEYPKPIIAVINGFALGGGLELAMAAHVRIASEQAKLGQPEVALGLIPGYGGTQRLTQLVGKSKAFEMILTGEMISAKEALSCKLVNYVVAKDELMAKAEELAVKMIKNSPNALKNSITAINSVYSNDGLQNEIELFGQCFGTDDFKEGVQAFLEKRKPSF